MVAKVVKCADCGQELEPENSPQYCPECGSEAKKIAIHAHDTLAIDVKESIKLTTIREFYEKNHKALVVVLLITIISPFIGLFFIGPVGAIVGFFLGLASFIVGPQAIVKVREIREKIT